MVISFGTAWPDGRHQDEPCQLHAGTSADLARFVVVQRTLAFSFPF